MTNTKIRKIPRKNHTIWSSDINIEDWHDMKEDYPELSEDEFYQKVCMTNDEYLDDERLNLNIALSQPIIVITDIGRWNGRCSGYKMIDSGNIKDCFHTECDGAEWYVDELGDLRAKMTHHDGINSLLYRVFKDNISEVQIENLQNKIYEGTVKRTDITRVTKRLGDEIANVYGFKI